MLYVQQRKAEDVERIPFLIRYKVSGTSVDKISKNKFMFYSLSCLMK